MKEILELRVNRRFAHLLFSPEEGRRMGDLVQLVTLSLSDPRCAQIAKVRSDVWKEYGENFFWGWQIKRSYTKKELGTAALFHIQVRTTFEPSGEECGTIYDETTSCPYCGAGATQRTPLRLRERSIPRMDIARTTAGEIVVSEAFASAAKKQRLKGISLEPVVFSSGSGQTRIYYQMVSCSPPIEFAPQTIVGIDPFNLSKKSGEETYECPRGHTLGLNLISEPFIRETSSLHSWDLFATRQKLGVRRGLLRPEVLYACSPAFRKTVQDEELRGFRFEIAHVVTAARDICGAPHSLDQETACLRWNRCL